MSPHMVRLRSWPGQHVAVCACGWRVHTETPRAAAWAAQAHCFTVAPDAAVECGRDGGGVWWRPEVLS